MAQANLKYVQDRLVFINLRKLMYNSTRFLFASLSACQLLLVTK